MKAKEEIIASCPIGADLDSYLHGYANGYTDKEAEQPSLPDGLEEAAEESWAEYEYRETPQGLYSSCYKDGFIAGAGWTKAKMMEDAVEGYVNYYEDSGGILMAEAQVGCPYHNGDKVKIIIVKEEQK